MPITKPETFNLVHKRYELQPDFEINGSYVKANGSDSEFCINHGEDCFGVEAKVMLQIAPSTTNPDGVGTVDDGYLAIPYVVGGYGTNKSHVGVGNKFAIAILTQGFFATVDTAVTWNPQKSGDESVSTPVGLGVTAVIPPLWGFGVSGFCDIFQSVVTKEALCGMMLTNTFTIP